MSLKRIAGQEFRLENTDAYLRFATDAAGRVIGLVLRQNGVATEATRIASQRVLAIDGSISKRVRDQTPTPGSEAALHQLILGIESGKPDYAELSPQVAGGTRAMLSNLQATMKPWGPLRSIEFRGVDSKGWDHYLVPIRAGHRLVGIALDSYGQIVGAGVTHQQRF